MSLDIKTEAQVEQDVENREVHPVLLTLNLPTISKSIFYINISTGFSSICLNVWRNFAPVAPSITR